jgi:AraC-like DNA-binding protein
MLLIKDHHMNLTNIGYETGYFDQAHFSKEFKAFSKTRPKDFLFSSPYYRLLSEYIDA